MKTIRILMLSAVLLTSLGMSAEKLTAEQVWAEGMSWTELQKVLSWDEPKVIEYSLVDSKTVDGRVYSNLAIDGEKTEVWIYVDSNRVYECSDPEQGVEDKAGLYMFDFTNWEEQMSTKWYGTYEEEIGDYYCRDIEFLYRTKLPEAYAGAPEVWAYYSEEGDLEDGNIWIEGIGYVGFCGLLAYPNQSIISSTTYHFVSEVRLPDGKVIYQSQRAEAGVAEIQNQGEKNTTVYDLYGRQTVNFQPGCIYVSGGKKIVYPTR